MAFKKKKNEKEVTTGQNPEEEEEKAGSKLVLALVTVLIIAIWLGIIAILIKTDVGGFGSSVLYPALKDVPYINKILPTPDNADLLRKIHSINMVHWMKRLRVLRSWKWNLMMQRLIRKRILRRLTI